MPDAGHSGQLAPSFLPATAVLEMTYRCNHACLFCSCPWYAKGNGFDIRPELGVPQWKEIIKKLCGMGACNMAFTGGEPLLKDGLAEIIEYAASCKSEQVETENGALVSRWAPPKLFLLSNGRVMTDDILKLCKKHGINLSLSLPGLTTFTEHTGIGDFRSRDSGPADPHRDGGPDNVLQWFKRAHDAGVTTTVGVTVTRKNIFELYETISEALIAGADNLLINRFLPGGRGLEHMRELSLNAAEIRQMLDIAEDVLRKANRTGSVGTELPKCFVEEGKYKRLKVGTRCSAALDFFTIDPSGYVRVCNHSPTRLHHFSEVDKVKDHPYWKKYVAKDYSPALCKTCGMLASCDGGCPEAAHIVGHLVDEVEPQGAPAPAAV